jgi:hypothetical protein
LLLLRLLLLLRRKRKERDGGAHSVCSRVNDPQAMSLWGNRQLDHRVAPSTTTSSISYSLSYLRY